MDMKNWYFVNNFFNILIKYRFPFPILRFLP